jgi:hypothetical protein
MTNKSTDFPLERKMVLCLTPKRMVDAFGDGVSRDFVESDALGALQSAGFGDVPGNRFAFAVGVSGEIDLARFFGETREG